MKRIPNQEQEKDITYFKKHYPKPIFVEPKHMAMLSHPEKWPNSNFNRLGKELVENGIKALGELSFLIEKLSKYYRLKLLDNHNLNSFCNNILNLNEWDKKELDEKSKSISFDVAMQQLIFGLHYLTDDAPPEFRNVISYQIRPFISILNGISQFTKNKDMIPASSLNIPDIFYPID